MITLQETHVRLEFRNNILKPRDQIQEYKDQGRALQCMNLFDFILNSYDTKKWKKKAIPSSEQTTSPDSFSRTADSDSNIDYLPECRRDSKTRAICQGPHETLLDFIGGWFPNRELEKDKELYAVCILCLFQPWRQLADIAGAGSKFQSRLDSFVLVNPFVIDIMDNINYFHKCLDSVKQTPPNWIPVTESDLALQRQGRSKENMDETGCDWDIPEITETDIEMARILCVDQKERRFAERSMDDARRCGLFVDLSSFGTVQAPARIAKREEIMDFSCWHQELLEFVQHEDSYVPPKPPSVPNTSGFHTHPASNEDLTLHAAAQPLCAVLNQNQRIAHTIIENHVLAQQHG